MEAVDEEALDEALGAGISEGAVEVEKDQFVDTEAGADAGALAGRLQEPGGARGREDAGRVGVEGDQGEARGEHAGALKEGLVTEVEAVEAPIQAAVPGWRGTGCRGPAWRVGANTEARSEAGRGEAGRGGGWLTRLAGRRGQCMVKGRCARGFGCFFVSLGAASRVRRCTWRG